MGKEIANAKSHNMRSVCKLTLINEKFESEASLLSQNYTHVEYMERLPIQVDTTQVKKVEKRSNLGHREK